MEKTDKNQGVITDEIYTDLVRTSSNMVRSAILETMPSIDYTCLDDLENDVWLRAWEKRDTFKDDLSSVTTWVYNIAVSVAQNYMRDSVERAPDVVSERALESPSEEYESWLEQNYIDYDDPMSLLIAEEEASVGYADLSPQEAQVFDMLNVQGLSTREVADALGITLDTVWVVSHNIRRKIS